MSTQDKGPGTFLANTTITANLAVVISTNGGIDLNGASTRPDGFAITDAASGDYTGVEYFHADGTRNGVAAVSVIAIGDTLYAAASGTISTTGSIAVGKAREAVSVTGASFEFIPNTL